MIFTPSIICIPIFLSLSIDWFRKKKLNISSQLICIPSYYDESWFIKHSRRFIDLLCNSSRPKKKPVVPAVVLFHANEPYANEFVLCVEFGCPLVSLVLLIPRRICSESIDDWHPHPFIFIFVSVCIELTTNLHTFAYICIHYPQRVSADCWFTTMFNTLNQFQRPITPNSFIFN